MKKIGILYSSIVLAVISICVLPIRAQEGRPFQPLAIQPAVGFEYFSRTIRWDETSRSELKSHFFTLETEVAFRKGIFFSGAIGFSFSSYDGLVFRELPVSADLAVGSINGYILGGAVRKSIVQVELLKVEAKSQFHVYFGKTQEWEIPGLVVEGTLEGKPNWMRFSIGPVFIYTGFERLFPYLYLNFNTLWGRFRMDETIEDLEGSETKRIKADGSFAASVGLTFELSPALSMKAEASFVPRSEGIDSGICVKTMLTF